MFLFSVPRAPSSSSLLLYASHPILHLNKINKMKVESFRFSRYKRRYRSCWNCFCSDPFPNPLRTWARSLVRFLSTNIISMMIFISMVQQLYRTRLFFCCRHSALTPIVVCACSEKHKKYEKYEIFFVFCLFFSIPSFPLRCCAYQLRKLSFSLSIWITTPHGMESYFN